MERVYTYRIKLHSPAPISQSSMADTNVKSTRRRASTPRSKKGCITCKIRRLKCGEEKPGCLRCAKSGWTCDGYEHLTESSTSQASQSMSSASLHPILPRASSSRSARSSISVVSRESRSRSPSVISLARTPLMNLQVPSQLEPNERYYFQIFLDETPVSLVGAEPMFWKNIAVQESHVTSSVRHALVALGALMKNSTRTASGNYSVNPTEELHREFALQQHEKSIRGLREAISSSGTGVATRSIVLSCLILARLEPFIGNGGFSTQHIRYARQIMFGPSYHEPTVPNMFPNWNDSNDVTLHMFFQSDLQALTALGAGEDRSAVRRALEAQNMNMSISVPSVFRDLEEAREYSNIVCQEARMFWYRSSLQDEATWPSTDAQSTIDMQSYHLRQLQLLFAAFETVTVDSPEDLNNHPLRRPSSVRLQAVHHSVEISLALNTPESSADRFLPYFQYIVSLGQQVVDYERIYESSAGHQTYAFECRIIAPLFLVARKCRDAALRRQAIRLLLSSRRQELFWDSMTAGNVGFWILTLEEEGKNELGYISDSNRAWGHSMELDLQRKVTLVRCRLGPKIPGQWIERSTEIPYNEVLS
ncbi:Zn2/Cys6 DNA-binding protein [Glarea lozoyensis ATCC 20868]|uniref:Zn2/Cys6 DNA-binding protein n=1 Tax=Glarea lozoyensis (strain ATCC 20868 / MF5171) TaxID=1116229 RepID=S3CVZ6_GLAL2|nr:Zn2/Cys6 DNA-binding protein [Glarea lozoyensis ATCC 20868]EPE30587.1 Zn2/Cys6 DNA-binding protein [Glarea lozoyensis ATCC 20868]